MRSSKRNDPALLDDIRVSAAMIAERLAKVRLPDFVEDIALQDGIIRRLAIIGEAAKNLTDDTRRKYPDLPWREMMRFRDKVTHGYWNVDAMKIWTFVHQDVGQLLEVLGDGSDQ